MKFSWSIFVKDTHVFYANNAVKALFVWFRRRKDSEHLTSFVLGKYQQQEPGTKTVNLQAELVNICHYGEENVSGWVGSTVITHLQYPNLQINSVLLGTKHRRCSQIITQSYPRR